jgi:SNF2 family DNA or RNA helicase
MDAMSLAEDHFVSDLRNGRPDKTWYGKKKGQPLKYRWKTKPFHHQVAAIKTLLNNGYGGALLMEPRTGKTKVAIDWIAILHLAGKVNRVLIFCPVSVMGVWEEQLALHCPIPYNLVVWDKKSRKKHDLPAYGRDRLDIVVLNYDAMSTAGGIMYDKNGKARTDKEGNIRRSRSRGGKYTMRKKLKAWQAQCIILDESHRIKSSAAAKSKSMHILGPLAPYRLIMTGTAVTKKKRVHDIWSQWKFLNPARFHVGHDPMTFPEFKSEFCVYIRRNGYDQWVTNKNTKLLRRLIHQDAFAITREECYDLPPRLDPEIIKVPLEESARTYDDMAADMVAKIHTGEITEASIKLVQGLRLQQITSGIARTESTPEHPKGRLVRIGREKLRILEDRLSDFFEADEKVVIAAQFIADIQAIEKLCQKLRAKTFILRGGVKRQDRDDRRRAFQDYDGPAAFIMQPSAGSLGIDLSSSGTFIWYSLTRSYVDYTQAEDRIALNPRGTRFIYLLGEDTYDEVLFQSLQEDGEVAREVMRRPESLLRSEELRHSRM